jgi:hypothetical protein
MNWLAGIFGSGTLRTVEKIASEVIETEKESAEAKAVMVKTLDPNGLMRRDISKLVGTCYAVYLVVALALISTEFFYVMANDVVAQAKMTQLDKTTDKVKELFLPITTLFGAIVTASFGVNAMNTHKNK